jgi:phage shock protein A
MGLFRRVGDIISANLNDLVERFEDPEKMLKQAIREMERAIGQARREVVRAVASEKLARKQLAHDERQAEEWQTRAVTALKAGEERTARTALVRKHETLKVVAALRDHLIVSSETAQTLRRQLAAMEVKLAEARRQLETFVARQRVAEVRARLQSSFESRAGSAGAFARFDELQGRVERMEAEAEALGELERTDEADALPLEDPAVEAELTALKTKIQSR